jgi:serine/threonine protein kinase
MGALLGYIDGGRFSDYALRFGGSENILPFGERVRLFCSCLRRLCLIRLLMTAAAEALDRLHSRGVYHRDISEANIIFVPGRREHFPMGFVDFGAAGTFTRGQIDNEHVKAAFEHDSTSRLLFLLIEYFGLTRQEARPLLRAIPRQGVTKKFVDAWNIYPTYEEKLQTVVSSAMSREGCTEETARKYLVGHIT